MKFISSICSFSIICFLLILTSCSNLPQAKYSDFRKISTGYGPEDMVLDTISEIHGILISCASRRSEYGEYGEIERFIPGKNKTDILKRIGEPENMVFKPHGINISSQNGKAFLYVISHDDANDNQFIVKYQINRDELIFKRIFKSPKLVSPNALYAFNDGRLLVCNDAKKRNSLYEKIFKLKVSNIVYMNEKEEWEILANKIGYAAGLGYSEGKVYVSAAMENKLYAYNFDGKTLTGKNTLAKINGPDNIRFYQDKIIVAGHFKSLAFIKHVNKSENPSPSTAYSIDKIDGSYDFLFFDDGRIISASSTAVIYKNKLYINQIFEPWLVEVSLIPE